MGRHAAEWPEPDSSGPDYRAVTPGTRFPLHADLFAPAPGSAAERAKQRRAAEAFDRLVLPHRPALLAYVERLTDGDGALAESIVKETFYRAAQDPARYPQRSSAVRPWLVLAARNVLRDGEWHAPAGHDDRPDMSRQPGERSLGPGGPDPTGPGTTGPAGGPGSTVPGTTVVGAIEELPGVHRELLVELFYDGVTIEDAAQDRGVPVETVKSGLYFAMRSLQAVLDQHLADRHGPQ